MTTIIVTHENNEIDEHDFEAEIKTITIGRRSTNDVCIPDLSVSGTHAKISISDTGAMVEDLSSTNGTYINGRLISRQLLNDGDDIVLGKVRLTYLQPNAALPDSDVRGDKTMSAVAPVSDPEDDEPPLTLAEKARLLKSPPIQATPVEQTPPQTNDIPVDDTPLQEPDTSVAEVPKQIESADLQASASEDDDADPVIDSLPDKAINSASHNRSAPNFDDSEDFADLPAAHTHNRATPDGIVEQPLTHELDNAIASAGAVIEIKNGAKSGQVLPIDKPVTTLGRPGIQIAAIMKKPEGYFLMHIESDDDVAPPRLNSHSIGDEPVLLQSGDALNVAGIDVQFMLS